MAPVKKNRGKRRYTHDALGEAGKFIPAGKRVRAIEKKDRCIGFRQSCSKRVNQTKKLGSTKRGKKKVKKKNGGWGGKGTSQVSSPKRGEVKRGESRAGSKLNQGGALV